MALCIDEEMRSRSHGGSANYGAGEELGEPELHRLLAGLNNTRPEEMFKPHGQLGRTVLRMAAREGNAETVEHLLSFPQAANYIYVRDVGGKTAVDLAEREGHYSVARLLKRAT